MGSSQYLSKKKNNYIKPVTIEITLLEFFPTNSLSKLAKNNVDEILAERNYTVFGICGILVLFATENEG